MNTPQRPKQRLLAATLVAIALAALVIVSGCGGSGGGGGGSAQDILRQTFGANKPVHSGKLSLSLALDLPNVKTLKGPVAIKLEGPFQSTGKGIPKFNFTLGITASGQTFTAGATSTGDKAYLNFLGNNYAVSDQQFATFRQGYLQAQANSTKQHRSTLSSLGINPLQWLTSPQKAGTASVGGTTTDHIQAGIDVSKLLEDVSTLLSKAGSLGVSGVKSVPRTLTPAQKASIQKAVKTATVDIYAGRDDRVLRRLTVNIALTSGSIAFDLQIGDLNHDQTITTPANAQPLSALLNSLGSRSSSGSGAGLLGGATGGSGSAGSGSAGSGSSGSPGSSGGSASPSPAAGQAYLNCLQKAGQNIPAAQKCGALIGR